MEPNRVQLRTTSLPKACGGVQGSRVGSQRRREMQRLVLALVACLFLVACGLGETAVSTAVGGASAAEQATEALKTEARVKQQLDAAAALDAQRRQAAAAGAQ